METQTDSHRERLIVEVEARITDFESRTRDIEKAIERIIRVAGAHNFPVDYDVTDDGLAMIATVQVRMPLPDPKITKVTEA